MAPPNWKPCSACGKMFSPASLHIHVKRCRDHEAVKLENDKVREQRMLRNIWGMEALPDWKECPICGEKCSPVKLAPHVKRCRALRERATRATDDGGTSVFNGMWGVDERPLPMQAMEALGSSLKSLLLADAAPSEAALAASIPSDAERQRLR